MDMDMKKLFYISFSAVVVLLAFACGGAKIDTDLEGRWKKVVISKSDPDSSIWNFSGGTLFVTYPNDTNRIDTGYYSGFMKGTVRYVNIRDLRPSKNSFENLSADWYILKLNTEQLIMCNNDMDGPENFGTQVTIREFTRINDF
jgi:hypothetical protein